MPNYLRQAMPMFYGALRDNLGDPVVYRQGVAEFNVALKLSREPEESASSYSAILIPADLPVVPQENDQIEHQGAIWQVVRAALNEYGAYKLVLRMLRRI